MKSMPTPVKFRRGSAASALVFLGSCVSMHCGSDDSLPVASAGKGGTSGASGTTGRDANVGSSGVGGSGGSAPGGAAGTAVNDSGTDASNSGGDASMDGETLQDANAGDAADAGDAAEDVFVDPTVRGTLRSVRGLPLEGLTVLIGQSTAVSNARGEFTIQNVPPKYDLVVLPNSSKGALQAHVYIDLTTRQPVPRITMSESFLSARVGGTFSPVLQQGQALGVGFKAANQDVEGQVVANGGSTFGPFDVRWTLNTTISGEIFALRWSVGTAGNVTGYQGWVRQPMSLSSGMPVSIDLPLGTASTREVSGTLRFPLGTAFLSARLTVESLSVFSRPVVPAPGATSHTYAYPVPVGVGNAARILSFSGGPLVESRARLTDSATTVDFELPAQPNLALPVDQAGGVDSTTEFAWTPVPNAIYRLAVTTQATGTGYLVHTASTNGKIPDLTSKGVPLAAGTHQWTVGALGPSDKVDSYVTGTSILDERGRDFTVYSTTRTFTARSQ
jgi:hypothetical protein